MNSPFSPIRRWFLALAVFCGLSLHLSADQFGDFTYTSDGSAITITGYTGAGGAVSIPATIISLPVTTIGEQAFYNKTTLISVSIPASVNSIGSQAFRLCQGLTAVSIPNSITSIGEFAFDWCTSLTTVTIPSSVTRLESQVFGYCGALTSVRIPNSVTSIGNRAFFYCGSLTSVSIPNSVTSIGPEAFKGCTALATVSIPNSVTRLEYRTFEDCWKLTSITIPESVTVIGDYAFSYCGLERMTIPAGVTYIGEAAFAYCPELTSVLYMGDAPFVAWNSIFYSSPKAITYYYSGRTGFTIPTWNGSPCVCIGQSLAEISLEEPVRFDLTTGNAASFGAGTHSSPPTRIFTIRNIGGLDLTGLMATSVGLNTSDFTVTALSANSLPPLDTSTFEVTFNPTGSGLRTATLRIGSNDADENPFEVLLVGNPSLADAVDLPGFVFTTGGNAPWVIETQSTHDGLDVARSGAITRGQESWMETSVTGPGTLAFWCMIPAPYAYSSEDFVLGFYVGGVLQPSAVNLGVAWQEHRYAISIGTHTLRWNFRRYHGYDQNIARVDQVSFTQSSAGPLVTTIAAGSVMGTTATLTGTVNPTGLATTARFEYGRTTSYGSTATVALSPADGAITQIIAANLTGLLPDTTYHYRLTASNSLGTTNGEDMTFATLSAYIYSISNGEVTITGYRGPGGAVEIPATIEGLPVTAIGSDAFTSLTNVTSVNIPASVTSIVNWAFYNCTAMTAITVDIANPNYSSQDGVLFNRSLTTLIQCPIGKTGAYAIPNGVTSIGPAAFRDCYSLTSVTIPVGVTSIESWAFASCYSLTSITIPDSITSIGGAAFYSCSSLVDINIPGSVTNIGESAFSYCYSLSSVIIPASVTSVGAQAFMHCTGLTSVSIPASVTSIGNSAFAACTDLTSVSIPASVISIEEGAFASCSGLTSVSIPASVTSIGRWAFYDCPGLTSAAFLGNAPTMGSSVFYNTAASFSVYYLNTSTDFTSPTWQGYPAVGLADPGFITHPASTTINSGGTATLAVNVAGTDPFTFQWYEGVSGDTGSPVGLNSATFTTPALMNTTSYWVRVTNAANPIGANSNTASVTVNQPAAIATHPASITINSGATTTLTVIASGTEPLTYQWYQGASGTTTTPVGTNSASFITPALSITTSYWVKVTNAANPAGADSDTATVTVNQPAAIATHPASITITSGAAATLTVIASGTEPFTYQWYQGASGTTTAPVGTNSNSFTTPALAATTSYWVKVTNAANPTGADSNTATVTVNQPVQDALDLPGAVFSFGGTTPWFGQSVTTHDGVDAARSGAISHYQESWMETTVSGPGSLSFWCKVSSESGYDFLEFYLDGVLQSGRIAGEIDWQQQAHSIPAGTHTVKWRYIKDGSVDSGQDAAWVDEVTLGPLATPLVSTGTAIWETSATTTLTGTVNPNGIATAAQFEYGPTTAYGSTATVTLSPNNGTVALNVSADLGTLPAGTTYHYRLTATNAGGTTAGADRVFVTERVSGAYKYTTCDTTATITGYTGAGGAVTIPGTLNGLTVTAIGCRAFYNKNTLTSVSIPAGVTSIGNAAFYDCTGLTSVSLPASVTSIGSSAFLACTGLTSITLPARVTSIGSYAFYGCTGLTSIAVDASNPNYGSADGVLFNKALTMLIQCPEGKTGAYVIPASVTSIGSYAFFECSRLTSVTLPASVTSIGSYAFLHCTGLTNVSLSASVISIGQYAFANTGLTSVSIPASVTSIGSDAFSQCSVMTAIVVDAANPNYSSQDGVLLNKALTTLIQCPGGKTGAYAIPASVTSIGSQAFYSCTVLTNVAIPANVTSIGSYAFSRCSGLTAITVDAANPSFSSLDGVLFNKALTTLIQCPEGKTGAYAIPTSVTNIGNGAFFSCTGLTSVSIPASVTSIESYAFSSCTGLTSVSIPASVTSIGSSAFSSCTNLARGLFTGNAPTMGSSVFSNSWAGVTVYFLTGASGFTTPTWNGYPAVALVDAPEIAVEQPAGTNLTTGGNLTYGTVLVGGTPASKTFTIKNPGGQNLTGLLVSVAGAHPGDFQITQPAGTSVAPLESTTFTVEFAPTASGTRQATLNIVTNDGDENPFSLALSGTGTAPVPASIATHPDSREINSGDAVSLSVVANGTAPLAYQWYQGPSGTTTTPVGSNSASFTTPPLTTPTSYWVRVSNAANPTGANSNAATITIRTVPTLFWDGNIASANSASNNSSTSAMNWLSGGNWDSGATSVARASWAAGTVAVFGGTTTGQTVTLASAITIGGISFDTANYTLAASTINLSAAAVPIAANAAATITSTLASTGGLVKSGAGTLILNQIASSFSGNVVVNSGTLQTGSAMSGGTNGHLGLVNGARTITVNQGATLRYTGNNVFGGAGKSAATIPSIILNGSTLSSTRFNIVGNLTMQGAVLEQAATDTGNFEGYQFLGKVTVSGSAASTISSSNGKANHLINGTNVFEVNDATSTTAPDLTISNPLRNSSGNYGLAAGSLTKTGAGTMVLSGTNTYTGITTISGGLLSVAMIDNGGVAGNLGQATNASANLVLNGGILRYTGVTSTTDRGMTLNSAAGNGIEVTGSSATLTDSGILTGAGGFAKSGAGVLYLLGGNSFTGITTVAAGTLRLGSNGTVGTTAAGTNVASGAVLDLNGRVVSGEPLTLNGTGISNGGALINGGTWGGPITLASASSVGGTGTSTLSGVISGAGSLTKVGSGTLVLAGANPFTGDTVVSFGTLRVNGSLAAAGTVTVNSGATLGGTGTIQRAVTAASGAILTPGSPSTGALSVASCTFAGAAAINLVPGATRLNVTAADGLNPAGGAGSVTLNLPSTPPVPGTHHLIAYSGAIQGAGFGAFKLGTVPAGFACALKDNAGFVDVEVTTLLPLAVTGTVTGIGATSATLTGTVNPNGLTTTARFEYGATTDYGSAATVTLLPTNGTTPQNVSANLSGLAAGGFYHYRLIATNANGGIPGEDGVFATERTFGDYRFTTVGNTATLTGYAGAGGNLIIPATLNGLPVTAIDASAFANNQSLTSVTIPATVEKIGDSAFAGCANLASAIFLGNAPVLGTGVFDSTADGFTVYYYENRTGFSSPLWQGYPAVSLGAAAPEIAVEQPAGTPLASGSGSVDFGTLSVDADGFRFKSFTLKNTGADPLTGIVVNLAGPAATDFSISMAPPTTVSGMAEAEIVVAFSPTTGGVRDGTLSIASNDADESPFVIRLTGTGTAAPVITAQPLAAQTVAANASVALTVAASGYPAPTFQWYQGASGDTLSVVEGATAASFTTPALNASISYWVRATNEHGFADSAEAAITVELPPSANPNLAGLEPLFGTLTPAFDPAIVTYRMNLPHEATEITLTPTVAENGATVTINGPVVASGTPSEPIPLAVGNSVAIVAVAAADGVTSKTYVVTFARAAAVAVSTDPAEVLDATTATLKGTVTPHGTVSAYFEYGPTTDYGTKTAAEEFSGALPLAFNARLEGLAGATPFHYRAVAVGATGPVVGDDVTFTTAAEAPQAATGQPSAVTATSATFQGAVHPKGQATQVHFEYGFTAAYGRSTTAQPVSAGAAMMELAATATDLIANVTYHCRIVATNGAGTTAGADVVFVAQAGTPGGTATQPVAITGAAVGLATDSAILQGGATPNRGTTVAWIEFGITTGYGRRTADQDVGNGAEPVAVSLPADGLLAGTVYHYRMVARNSLGTTPGEDRTFTTLFSPPAAVTGAAEILTRTQARVSGTVRANGAAAEVWFDYGTDGFTFPQSVRGTPATVTGDTNTAVSAELSGLAQGVTYSYRVRAQVAGDSVPGGTESFAVALLSGLIQDFPAAVPLAERQGTVTVNLTPPDIASGWRIQGEHTWRNSGTTATGLVSGDRVLEYRPVPGSVQPESEPLTVVSGAAPRVLDRAYTPAGTPSTGRLTATLKPRNSAEAVDESVRLQWRLAGDSTTPWLDSGSTLRDLAPGNYLIECKDIPNRLTPEMVSAVVANSKTTAITLTYQTLPTLVGTPPAVLDYETVTGSADRPYAYVGQLRNDTGNGSGFVVRPGVVVTAGHVVFDDGTLSAATGLQWLFQRDRGTHEPLPQLPRGHHLMTGYAAQRALENTPGYASPQSQALDAAALYFLADAGRGGFSGYLASESVANEFLLSPALKTLVGFPVSGIASADRDRMHATPPANVAFAPAFGGTYTTTDIRSFGGSSGGPLCVRFENGNYYPAAIYLGGTNQAVVRAIDGAVADLIGFAETSCATDLPGTGGSLTQTGASPVPTEAGILEVFIEPAAARAAGAGWRVLAQASYQASGTRKEDLDPNTYTVEFATIPGFLPPARPAVAVQAHQMANITFTYEKIILPPVITSADGASGQRNQPLSYQITALNQPDHYQLQGTLPDGMGFDATTGLISGTPTQAGSFVVTVGASNASGAASRTVAIAALPVVGSQSLTAPFNQPLNYQIASSESGDGLTYVAENLPAGLTLNPSSGLLTGTPAVADSYVIPISVTVRSATGHATLTLNITATAPVFTLQPVPDRTISHGAITTLEVAATGQPAPTFQWFEGDPGDTTRPVPEATRATFSTPPLTTATRYWVHASNNSGSVDSTAALISVLPSTNPNLAELLLSAGHLSPGFNASIANYAAAVPHAVSEVSVTAVAEVSQTTLTINGVAAALDTPNAPIALAVGTNTLVITATAGDGVAMKTYTLTVTRAPAATVVTGDATAVTDHTATLNGTVTPNGQVTAFFEYGTTTAYGDATPPQDFSGSEPLAVQAPLTGLPGDTGFHYRLVVTSAADPVAGADRSFTTSLDQAVAATGDAAEVGTLTATLVGAVATNGQDTQVYFQLGTTTAYGTDTPVQTMSGASGVTDVFHTANNLVPDTFYHYRFVATNALGTVFGEDVTFQAVVGGGGPGNPAAIPEATTGAAIDLTSSTALLQGMADPNYGITLVHFEYGLTTAYGSATTPQGVGNADAPVNVALGITGLQPGKTYHYRLVAENSAGADEGADATFITGSLLPEVTTGAAEALSATSAILNGGVRARSAEVAVSFEVGTDGTNFPTTVQATPATVGGELTTPVAATLGSLDEHTTYYYRVKATAPGRNVPGTVMSFKTSTLLGLGQDFGRELHADEHRGEIVVSLVPVGLGGWRFVGETAWRPSNVPVAGLATGTRDLEFRPVTDYVQPQSETLIVVSGEAPVVIERFYLKSATPGTAAIQVALAPAERTGQAVPAAARFQWRLLEDADPAWRDSGTLLSGLMPGSYLVECKPVSGWEAPTAMPLVVGPGQTRAITLSYLTAAAPMMNPPKPVPFNKIANDRQQPYAHVGQVRGPAGTYSGFVVKRRVVATVAQAVFDEATLATVTYLQWLPQRENGGYEPDPQFPVGCYIMDDYAAQRLTEASPGNLSLESQNRNVAALYFSSDAGRGGYSGFLASDRTDNEFLRSTAKKTLIGYPTNGVSTANQGRMHASAPVSSRLDLAFDRTFTTGFIRGYGGMAGGPLCVQHHGGAFLPAGIYVGGTTLGTVRAIDAKVVDLFTRAEDSGNGGDDHLGGGITMASFTTIGSATEPGGLKVLIEPAAARLAFAGWRLQPETSYRFGGTQKTGLNPGSYVLEMKPLAGFQPPSPPTVVITGGVLQTVTFDYREITPPPVIASAATATGTRGFPLVYQISASNGPTAYTLDGTLPGGLVFNSATGLISGTLDVAGVFNVTLGATNSGGTGTLPLALVARPSVPDQRATEALGQPFTHPLTSSESGAGVTYAGAGLPDGVALHPTTGVLSGTPPLAGEFIFSISVTKGGATGAALFTLTVTPSPLEAWRQLHFGTTEPTGDAADAADPDRDTKLNLDEYAAGTDPNNPTDFFKVLTATKTATTYTVTAAGKAGRTYVLERSTDAGTWTGAANSGPLAADAPLSLTDHAPPPGTGIYRLRVTAP